MYQSVGSDGIEGISKCMQLPLYRIPIWGKANVQSIDYTIVSTTEKDLIDEDEVESLFYLLFYIKVKKILHVIY